MRKLLMLLVLGLIAPVYSVSAQVIGTCECGYISQDQKKMDYSDLIKRVEKGDKDFAFCDFAKVTVESFTSLPQCLESMSMVCNMYCSKWSLNIIFRGYSSSMETNYRWFCGEQKKGPKKEPAVEFSPFRSGKEWQEINPQKAEGYKFEALPPEVQKLLEPSKAPVTFDPKNLRPFDFSINPVPSDRVLDIVSKSQISAADSAKAAAFVTTALVIWRVMQGIGTAAVDVASGFMMVPKNLIDEQMKQMNGGGSCALDKDKDKEEFYCEKGNDEYVIEKDKDGNALIYDKGKVYSLECYDAGDKKNLACQVTPLNV